MENKKHKGLFISIEGPDGSGKSTQIANIRNYLENTNKDFVFTREPGGTVISEKIREIILDKNHVEMSDRTEALLYAAARAQHVEEKIVPALNQGKIVICDRFVDSSIVYQGIGRGLGDDVKIINDFAIDKCTPDLTILFLLDPAIGKSRISVGNQDRLELEKIDFHYEVYEGYKKLAEKYPNRIVTVDAGRDIETIKNELICILERYISDSESSQY